MSKNKFNNLMAANRKANKPHIEWVLKQDAHSKAKKTLANINSKAKSHGNH